MLRGDEGRGPGRSSPRTPRVRPAASRRVHGQTRAVWLELLRGEAKERDVYVFTKHEGGPPDDPHGGVGLAGWLADTTRGEPSPDITRPPSTLGP